MGSGGFYDPELQISATFCRNSPKSRLFLIDPPLRVRIRTPVVCYDSVRRVTEHRQMAAWHLRTMILALKHVLQDFFRRCGLSTGLFCTHPRNKCRRGRVTVGAGVKSIFTTNAPECSLSGLMILKKNLSIHDTRSFTHMYSLVQVKYADGLSWLPELYREC